MCHQLEKIIPEKVIPAIVAHFSLGSLNAVSPLLYTIRTFGLGESSIAARVEESKPDSELIDVSYRATFPEVQVLFRGEINKASESQVEATALNAISQIGTDFVFSRGKGNSLPEVIHNMLLDSEKTLSLAESCSGGMLGCLLTDMAGSSRYFLGSYVTYSNDLKCSMLGISKELIEEYGAVSAEVAVAMAKAAREKSSSDISVSITGIAGPQGGSEQKPVGTCFLALSDKQGAISARIFFSGSRKRMRQYACHAALDLIRRRILGFPIDKPVFLDVSEL